MVGKLLLTASVLALACAAFIGASWARTPSSKPDLPSWLPASALPKAQLSQTDQVAINNLISREDAARYGVTSDSFANARVLTKTEIGSLYVIPGRNGICLALASAVACSDDLANQGPAVVALLVSNQAKQFVGGGLTRAGRSGVKVVMDDGSQRKTTPTLGGFVVTSADAVGARDFAGFSVG